MNHSPVTAAYIVAAVLPEFSAQKHGNVITTSSVAGLEGA